jgi:hypothetical protein
LPYRLSSAVDLMKLKQLQGILKERIITVKMFINDLDEQEEIFRHNKKGEN